MKQILVLISAISLCGCSHFSTSQSQEESILDATGKVVKIVETTTRAGATTFFDSKSQLANFKATQTDKTQSASVGSLSQDAGGGILTNIISAAVGAAVTAAASSVKP